MTNTAQAMKALKLKAKRSPDNGRFSYEIETELGTFEVFHACDELGGHLSAWGVVYPPCKVLPEGDCAVQWETKRDAMNEVIVIVAQHRGLI